MSETAQPVATTDTSMSSPSGLITSVQPPEVFADHLAILSVRLQLEIARECGARSYVLLRLHQHETEAARRFRRRRAGGHGRLVGTDRLRVVAGVTADPVELALEELDLAWPGTRRQQTIDDQLGRRSTAEAHLVAEHHRPERERRSQKALAPQLWFASGHRLGRERLERGYTAHGWRVRREEDRRVGVFHRLTLGQEPLPDLRGLLRVVARPHHQLKSDLVGLTFVVTGEGEDARQHRELHERSNVSDSRRGGQRRQEERRIRLGADVPKGLERMPPLVVPDLVTENVRELRFIVGAEEQPRPHL